jgi:uncharacterized repeat protein (TIGR01451 family)
MQRFGKQSRGVGGALLLCALSLGGCAQLRLPAIDPSGERIFLPAPNSTTVVPPADVLPRLPGLPQPAFTTPPTPPPCPQPIAGAAVVPASIQSQAAPVSPTLARGIEGQLQLAPTRVIAPVGSEVVLLAGLCSGDGYLVMREPIEWMLSQDSVGQFVEVGDGGSSFTSRLLHKQPKKLNGNFAVGRTATATQVITRGTPTPVDDIALQKGQNWISVNSATEGNSYVTAYASGAQGWDRRRQTATIHWIDAQWALPPPAIVRAGQKHVLTTAVSRSAAVAPIAGWIVRYEVTSGVPAGFTPGNSTAIEVQTNATGRADAELVPQSNQGGTTQVLIQIIRPASAGGDLPRMVVGQGWTSVTWSAPGLAVRMTGPEIGGIDAVAMYRIEVSNPGDMPTRDVTVSDTLPAGLAYIDSNPPGQLFGNRIEWRLGDLPARSARAIDINCRLQRRADARHCVTVLSADGLAAEDCLTTRVLSPSLSVKMTGPEMAEVGTQVQYKVEVTNISDLRLTGVQVSDRFDAGLDHSEGQRSPIVRSLGDLAPGETKPFAVTFNVTRPGRLCHVLDVVADGAQTASANACLTATQAAPVQQPSLRVRKTGPRQKRVGEIAEYMIEVTNTGNSPLTNVRITEKHEPALEPKFATENFQRGPGELSWLVARMMPGETQTRQVNCQCLNATSKAVNRVTVTCDQNVVGSDEVATEILTAASPVSPRETQPAPAQPDVRPDTTQPVSGELRVRLTDQSDPIKTAQRTSYLIIITNDRNVSDKNVTLTITIPDGMRFEKLTGPTGARGTSTDGRTIQLTPVAEMRAGETLAPYRVEVTAMRGGKFRLRAEVTSLRSEKTINVEEETTVFVE